MVILTSAQQDASINAAVDSANLIIKSIGPDPSKPLTQLSFFPGGPNFFDKEKMKVYIRKNFTLEPYVRDKSIEGESITELATKFSDEFGASGKYGFPIGASVSGSLNVELDIKSEQRTSFKYAQTRLKAVFGTITLPPPVKRDELRSLASESTLKIIDGCDSKERAEEIIRGTNFGTSYIQQGVLGACLVMSSFSNSSEYSSSEDLKVAVETEVKFLGGNAKGGNTLSIGRNKGNVATKLEITVEARGGDVTKILNGDQEGWNSTIKDNPILSDFTLAPISDLALEGSKSEKYLLDAIQNVCLGELGKFKAYDITDINQVLNKNVRIKSLFDGKYLYALGSTRALATYSYDELAKNEELLDGARFIIGRNYGNGLYVETSRIKTSRTYLSARRDIKNGNEYGPALEQATTSIDNFNTLQMFGFVSVPDQPNTFYIQNGGGGGGLTPNYLENFNKKGKNEQNYDLRWSKIKIDNCRWKIELID